MITLLVSYLTLLVLASPALFWKQTCGWVAVLMVVLLCDMMAFGMDPDFQRVVFPGNTLYYNWGYKGLSLVLNLIIAIILIASREFRSRELGLSFLQAPGTGRVLLTVVLPFLVLLVVLPAMYQGAMDHTLEALLFQATMPGLTEELTFRGIYLALFDRMFAARFRVFGAELGYGAIATSLAFGLVHAVPSDWYFGHVNYILGIKTALFGLFMVWVRCRSRSLVLPVMLHNLCNTVPLIMPKVF